MKNHFKFGICALLSTIAAVGYAQQTATVPAPTPYAVVSRGPNSQMWERTVWLPGPSGQATAKKESYVECASGLNFKGPSGQWTPSIEQISVLKDGTGAATDAPCKAYFPADIYDGAVKIVSPENIELQGRPIGLSYADGTNTAVMIAELTNSVGELVSSNEIVYPNAFSGISADVAYVFRKSGLEQDIVLHSQLPEPEQYSLNSADPGLRVQVLTEFVNSPAPEQAVEPLDPEDGLQDTTLTWGTMQMTYGKAFLTGGGPKSAEVPVYKSWVQIDGGNLLMEQTPYARIWPQLGALPPASAGVVGTSSRSCKLSLRRLLPSPHLAPAATNSLRLATADFSEKPAFLFDFVTVSSPETNWVFMGDTTYFLSGGVFDLYGTTVLEGGSVIKAVGSGEIIIERAGSIDCQTGPYTPCTFTSCNDNSIGEIITNSSGSPNDGDVIMFLYCLMTNNVSLHDLRFCYSARGVRQQPSIPFPRIPWLTLYDCQFEDVGEPVTGYNVKLCNDLFGASTNEAAEIASDEWPQVLATDQVIAENVTADSGYAFIENTESAYVPDLTNCLITGEPIYVPGVNEPTPMSNGVVCLPSVSVPVYQTSGGGNYYLATNSPGRGVGTTVIDPALLADLQQKTTFPPKVYDAMDISSLGTLVPQAPRDTNGVPDIGYHYPSVDFMFAGCDLETNLIVTAGTAIGFYDDYDTNGILDSITLNDGANLSFNGTATQPCIFARQTMIQENGHINWTTDTNWTSGAVTFNGSGNSNSEPRLSASFTKWTSDNWNTSYTGDIWAAGEGSLVNCEFYNAGMITYDMQNLYFTNCLFFRALLTFWDQEYALSFTFENCTFYNGCLFYGRYNGVGTPYNDAGLSSSFWQIENCSFDGTGFVWWDPLDANPTNTLIDYNSYNTNNLSWQTYPYPYSSPPVYGTNEVVGPDDLMVTNYNWENSWFGSFYLPSDSLLIYAGNTNANLLGLYHYTTTTNLVNGMEVPDGTNIVTIGYHYVATDANGNPLDSNGDGIPDYLEDANGDGIYDAGDLAAWNVVPDYSIPPAWYEANGLDPNNPLVGIQDPDGDGLLNQQEYLYGTNPQISEGFGIWVSTPNVTSSIP